jgi:RNA-directed DNA polymerase
MKTSPSLNLSGSGGALTAGLPPAGNGWHGHPLFSLDNLYRAYRQCRRRKRRTYNALRFEQHLEARLLDLHRELNAGTYAPGPSVAFLVNRPKRREVFAADFRDRVVHHLLVGHLEGFWEPRFIHDSYACRRGKGTLAGVERLHAFLRQATANDTRPAWYLQLDVRGFFINIDRQRLYARLASRERDPAVRWLIGQLLECEPTRDCVLRGAPRSAFESLPEHKTLFKARPGCGLPIGNLSSQFFANVYLDALDQFVKHRLKARWYLRYCDDLVLVSRERAELAAWESEIAAFLRDELGLALNVRRRLRPVADGVDFLGYIVRPAYRLVRRRVVNGLYQRLADAERLLPTGPAPSARLPGVALGAGRWFAYPEPLLQQIGQWLDAYWAHFAHADSQRLRARVIARFAWLTAYFCFSDAQSGRTPRVRRRHPSPRWTPTLRRQMAAFATQFPRHRVWLRLGRRWRAASRGAARDAGVVWVAETGRRLGPIAERAVQWRWESDP